MPMDDAALDLSGELAEELDAGPGRPVIDPTSIPVRFSRLKRMAQSAAHYYQAVQADMPSSLAMRVGSAVHAVLFNKPVVAFAGRRHGKAWDAFRAEHADKLIVSVAELERAKAVARSVREHPIAARLLFGEEISHEHTLQWSWLGRACQSTPDAYGQSHLVDLKTTACSEPGKFNRDGTYRAYHAQMAFYRLALRELGLSMVRDVYFVSVETVPPHVVTVLKLTPRALEQGERLARAWFERVLVCEQSATWPGYCDAIVDFDVPDDIDLVYTTESTETESV